MILSLLRESSLSLQQFIRVPIQILITVWRLKFLSSSIIIECKRKSNGQRILINITPFTLPCQTLLSLSLSRDDRESRSNNRGVIPFRSSAFLSLLQLIRQPFVRENFFNDSVSHQPLRQTFSQLISIYIILNINASKINHLCALVCEYSWKEFVKRGWKRLLPFPIEW